MDIREYVETQKENSIIHPWESARIDIVHHLLKKQINSHQKIKILDIGCGDAKIIDALSYKLNKSELIGVDTAFDEALISQISQKLDNPKIKLYRTLGELEKQNTTTDVILLLDILEHIENDAAFLKNCIESNFITDSTSILITVPAYQSLFVNRDKWLGHYRRYTLKSLKSVARNNNLKIVKTGYFFASLLPVRFLQKITEKKTKHEDYPGIDNWQGSKYTAWVVKQILILDFKLSNLINALGIKTPGLSCYMICTIQ